MSESGVGWLPTQCTRHMWPFSQHHLPFTPCLSFSYIPTFTLLFLFSLLPAILSLYQSTYPPRPRTRASSAPPRNLPGEPSSRGLAPWWYCCGTPAALRFSFIISHAFVIHLLTHSVSVLLVQSFIHSVVPALIHAGSSYAPGMPRPVLGTEHSS